jgi:AraC-like DNA-binding protein
MQIQLYHKGGVQPLKANKEIPAAYWTLQLPYASNSYLSLANAGLFRRTISGKRSAFSIWDCWADDTVQLELRTDGRFAILLHVANGDVSCNFKAGKECTLKSGYTYLLYLPPFVKHELRVKSGEHRLILSCVYPDIPREIGKNVSVLSPFLEQLKNGNSSAFCTVEAKVNWRTASMLRELGQASVSTHELQTALHIRLFEIFLDLLKGLMKAAGSSPALMLPGWIGRIMDAKKMVDEWDGPPLRISQVARKCRVNDYQLKLGFRLRFGQPFGQYQIHVRLERARKMLLETNDPVQTIGLMIGYEDESSFTKRFKHVHGLTPLQYRLQNRT